MTDLPVYPSNGRYASQQLQELLGTYWANYFGDKTVLSGLLGSRAVLFEQATQSMTEAAQLVARTSCPLVHNELWTPIYLKKSTMTDDSLAPLTYGADKALYGVESVPPYNRVFDYKSSLIAGSNGVFPMPEDLRYVRMITNRIDNPSLALVEGVDFRIDHDEHLLTLPIDVFNDPRVSTRSVYDENGMVDIEVILWAFSSDVDLEYLWKHYGFVFDVKHETGQPYKDLLNAVCDTHAAGPSVDRLSKLLHASMDVPVAVGDEVVEQILTGRRKQVVTDKNVYTVNAESDLVVGVGDELRAGDSLTDTVQILDLLRVSDGTRCKSLVSTSTPCTPYVILPELDRQPGTLIGTTEAEGRWGCMPLFPGSTAVYTPASGDPVSYVIPDSTAYCWGPYRNEMLSFECRAMPAHDILELEFDLLVFGLWKGNDGTATWTLNVDGRQIFETNFSNVPGSTQAYPQDVNVNTGSSSSTPTVSVPANPRYTGAVEPIDKTTYGTEINSCWSAYWVKDLVSDTFVQPAKYHISFKIPHSRSLAQVVMYVSGLPTTVQLMAVNTVPSSYGLGAILDAFPVIAPPAVPVPPMPWNDLNAFVTNPANYERLPYPFYIPELGPTYIDFGYLVYYNHANNPNPLPADWQALLDLMYTYYQEVAAYNAALAAYNTGTCRTNPGSADGTTFTSTIVPLLPYLTKQCWTGQELTANPRPDAQGRTLPSWVYATEFWGVQNLTVNALSAVRQSVPELPAEQVSNPDIPGISLDDRFMAGTYFASIFFPNSSVPLEYVGVDSQGFVEVRFETTGFPADVEQFWTDVHARGVAQGRTLANYLDQRPQAIGQPKAKDLPATVNPMLFILRHLMKNNLVIIKLRRGLAGPNALSADALNVLRWTLPPHMAYIIYTEVVAGVEEMTEMAYEVAVGSGPAPLGYHINAALSVTAPDIRSVDGVLV